MEIKTVPQEIDIAVLDSKEHLDVPDVFPQDYIYHYTSTSGLKGILENGTLWFTNIRYMNDKSEVLAGLQKFIDISSETMSEENKHNFMKTLFGENASIQDWWDSLQDNIFVCCFSLSKDELALWNYYTKDNANQGYNIGFNYKKLIKSILKKNKQLENCRFYFGLTDYLGKQGAGYIEKILEQIPEVSNAAVDAIVWQMISMCDVGPEYEEQKRQWLETIDQNIKEAKEKVEQITVKSYGVYLGSTGDFELGTLDSMFYFIKTGEYRVENEVRLVIVVPEDQKDKLKKSEDGICHFRISNGVLIPYIELKFDKEAISGLRLAPTLTSDLGEKGIRDFCEYCDISPEKFPEGIHKSEIPARF